MPLYIDQNSGTTLFTCNTCGAAHEVQAINGIAPEGWGTGQLVVDISLQEVRQIPLFFCTDHKASEFIGAVVSLVSLPVVSSGGSE